MSFQLNSGAVFDQNREKIDSFGNDDQALKYLQDTVLICDRSHWGVLQLKGADRQRFLHNQTTNNINILKSGQSCNTVFVNSTGRTLDLATAYITEDSIVLLVSPNRRQFLIEWMDRYLFPMDKVEITDISSDNIVLTLIGDGSDLILQKWGINDIVNLSEGDHTLVTIENDTFRIAVGTGLGITGYTLIIPVESALTVWQKLIELGSIPVGNNVWEKLRIKQGRPYPDQELTEDYNPLEVGLWQAISFDKGCYIGQETIARLNTYKGVKQRLWGVKLSQLVEPGTPVMLDDNKVGILTSCTEIEQEAFGLTYVKTKAGGEGLNITIGLATGELIALPFLSHEYYS
ncbi:YgfZ/GcvT domain-containing protein [Crocosphaera sp. UHCC 0190]|uniref:CAF17-like 4Fe-4S cluster assembly/insertion protein YgfZ n=1 Tax=Crocosphaera sp. UHCC 0190 TaxID=3110246 RepID=UPI003A521795